MLSDKAEPLPDLPVDPKLKQDCALTGNDLAFGDGRPIRGRPLFAMDKATQRKEASVNSCQKAHAAVGNRTGGVFTFFCRHGWCYG